MENKPGGMSGAAVGFFGLLVTAIVGGLLWRLLREIIGIELLLAIIVAGLVITGVSVWYGRYRADKKWREENRDRIEDRWQQRPRPTKAEGEDS